MESKKKGKAKYFSGQTSEVHEVEATQISGQLEILFSDGSKKAYFQKEYRIESKLGRTPRKISFFDGASLVFDHHQEFEKLFQNQHNNSLFHLEESNRLFVMALLSLIVTLAIVYFLVLPSFSKTLAPYLPRDILHKMGEQAEEQLLGQMFESKSLLSPTKTKEIQDLLLRIKKETQQPELKLIIRNAPEIGPNAFALPNRSIIISDQLIKLSESPEQIEAVLLHEIGHLALLHTEQKLVSTAIISLGVFVVIGPGDFTSIPLALLLSSYSRDAETEADTYAAEKLLKKHRSAASLKQILRKISESKNESRMGLFQYLSSHPETEARARRIDSLEKSFLESP